MVLIEKYIPNGQENAISQRQLAAVLQCSLRDVRLLVEQARRRGAPICSSCDAVSGGYYLPLSKSEARVYIKMQERRMSSAAACLKAVSDVLDTLPE